MPAIGIPLLGMFTGEFLHSKYLVNNPLHKVLYMVMGGIGLIIIGQLWNLVFPINKNLWSSSFICFSGLSLLLFSIFYLIIDVWQFKKWSLFLIVIGMNPITIYLSLRIINFESATRFFFGGVSDLLPGSLTPLINAIGITAIAWIFLYMLYKNKIFLKL